MLSDDIPAFLRLTAEERAAARAATPVSTSRREVVTSVKRGRYPAHWYDDPGTCRLIEEEQRKKMGQWQPSQRYQVFWRQEAGGELRFVGYHDKSRPDADWSDEFNAYVVEGGPPPEVDHPTTDHDGAVHAMPAVRELISGRKMTRAARRAEREARRAGEGAGEAAPAVGGSRPPKAKAPRGTPQGAKTKDKDAAGLPAAGVIRVTGPHGRRVGTPKHARAEQVVQHAGKTVGDYLAAEGNPTTLRNAVKEGWATVS